MGAKAIMVANPYTSKFLKGLKYGALSLVSHILKHVSADGITIHIFICISRSCVISHCKATVSRIGLAGQIDLYKESHKLDLRHNMRN